jgi:PII-like signaling protein
VAGPPPAYIDPEFSPRRECIRRVYATPGFLGRQRVKTSHLVDAGGKLPIIIVFVDTDDHVSRVLPKLKEMAAHRLIVRENVVLEQGNLD